MTSPFYRSPPRTGEPIIDDDNWQQLADELFDPRFGRGHIARDWNEARCGAVAAVFDLPIIPRKDWPDLIREYDEKQQRLSDIYILQGLQHKDQAQTNFCWGNAPVMGQELILAANGSPYIPLSPASICCPINGFRNQGGWGGQALRYLATHGAVPCSMWPANAIDRQYMTPETDAVRKDHRILEWYEYQNRNFDQLATAVLLGFPAAIGLNWWSHEVLAVDLVQMEGGKFGIRIINSWAGWGDRGMGILTEGRATPDDAVGPRSATLS